MESPNSFISTQMLIYFQDNSMNKEGKNEI